MKTTMSLIGLFVLVTALPVTAQTVNVTSGAKGQADSNVSVASDGAVSVRTRTKVEAETSISIGAEPKVDRQPQKSGQKSQSSPKPIAATSDVAPSAGQIAPVIEVINVEPAPINPAIGAVPQPAKQRPPLPCKKTVEAVNGDLRLAIINNYCSVKISIKNLWREGGKTHVEFEVDNAKGAQQAQLRLVEQWIDRSGRSVADVIDEQKIAIGKGRNVIFSVSGPTPAAVGGTLTLYK